jgi:signal transduction histidine kinase/CheY-like chemotaxis protein
MRRLNALLDDRFAEISLGMAKGFVVRFLTAILAATLMAFTVRPAVALAWFATFLAAEAWVQLARRPVAARGSGTTLQRLHFAVAGATTGCVWVAVSAIYWLTGSHVLQIVAICGLATILLSAQTQTARSLVMLVIVTAPSLLTLSVLTLCFSGFHGLGLFMVCIGLVMLAAHLVNGAIIHRQESATLERLQREAVAANEAKSAFLAMMSHEIRTPMNGVLGMAHALAQTPLNDEQRRQIDMLTRSGDGMMTILNDILDLSKIEAGRLTLEATVFDLHDVVNGVQALWGGPAREKGLDLTCELAPAVPRWVSGDPTRVRQILINHVSNAVKFTETGAVGVRVFASDDDQVLISVRDTGIGLTALEQDRLFQAFSQADASITRRFGGTGLGLSISKQLVSLMGGYIKVESTPGAGAEFSIVLRLPAAAAPPAHEARAGVDLGRLRILVAEDNRINQAVVQAVLGAIDAEVDLADDGAAALRMLGARGYDLVLMDIHMPNMDGIEALRRLRAGEAGRADQPVIALTADAMTGDAERFIALGFDAVESKPIQPARLIAAIGAVLEATGAMAARSAEAADRAA